MGIPSFSISEGQLFAGHEAAWGEAQSKDYVANHYHQPSDLFHEDWNFKGLAKMTDFGAALGVIAATQWQPIDWLPGDEFAKYQQAARSIDGDALFAGRPDLRLVSAPTIPYPPLARQTRIKGTVVLDVTVSTGGMVTKVEVLSGHPLLQQAPIDALKKWVFAPREGEPRTFRLEVEFALRTYTRGTRRASSVHVSGPLHLVILANGVYLETMSSSVAK